MAIRYVLHRRTQSADGRFTVQICVNRASRQLKLGTHLRIAPRHWSDRKGRLKPSAPGATELNAKLDEIAARTWVASLEHVSDEELKPEVLRILGREPQQKAPRLEELFEDFLQEKALRVKESTMITYRALSRHLKLAFGEDATTQDISTVFIDDLTSYLLEEGHQNSNINKYTQRLKGFLTWLRKCGEIDDVPERTHLKSARQEVVALTMDELGRLSSLELSTSPIGVRHARDLFVFGALTGQRFSDLQAIAWQNIDRERWLWNLTTQKTASSRRVPIIGKARSYLESRLESARPLPALSNQKANVYLKDLAQAAGFTRNVSKIKQSGGNVERVTAPLYEVISFHVSRKTYVTLMLQATGDLTSVLSITHDDLKTARQYIKTDSEMQLLAATKVFAQI